ncbi:MAG: phosphotransferase [Bacteroidota bacterium]
MNFLLQAEEVEGLRQYLQAKKWIAPDEQISSVSKPGEGNMNLTLRVRTNFRSFILKQSRDYVEKYPSIPAPRERAIIEGRFYELVQEDMEIRSYTPEITFLDEENSIIFLEDLGESSDFSFVYKDGKEIEEEDLKEIMHFISILHQRFPIGIADGDFTNRGMRELNTEHIFRYPLMEENGFDLNTVTEGLQEIAMTYKTDAAFKAKVDQLSALYTEDGDTLLHGDYYPGSWLKSWQGVKIIDPEFCFFGPASFDISVTIAHLMMAEQSPTRVDQVMEFYDASPRFVEAELWPLVGVEITRRLIGLAQLPLSIDLAKKEQLLKEAYKMIMA